MTDPLITNDKQAMTALKQHGGNIVMVILVVLLGYFGWQYYQKNYAKIDTVAADKYTTISEQVVAIDPADSTALQTVFIDIDALVIAHPNSVYAWQALMTKARLQADNGDYQGAADSLQTANTMGLDDKGLLAMSRLQLAEVMLANGDNDGALAMVNDSYPDGFEPSRLEILGDIYVAKDDENNAKTAYNQAWELLAKRQENRALLSLKMQALGLTPTPIAPKAVVVRGGEQANMDNPATHMALADPNLESLSPNDTLSPSDTLSPPTSP